MLTTKGLQIVVDTNVFISASLAEHSISRKALFSIFDHNGTILLSQEVLEEIEEVLNRDKLNKFSLLQDRILFFRSLIREAEFINITSRISDCPDPKDNKFLELAVDGNAAYIISGDNDLLDMNPFKGIKIISPSDFLKEFKMHIPH